MALVIDGGTAGATGNAVAGATGAHVIVSGALGDCTVDVYVSQDTSRDAPVFTFHGPGAIKLDTPAATVTATVTGGTSADVDVVIA
jgi:hypothetical protein